MSVTAGRKLRGAMRPLKVVPFNGGRSVFDSIEDGLNISSSFVEIRTSLSVASSPLRPSNGDRELFELEVDDGPSRVVIDRLATVDLRGYWGSPYDDVNFNSLDMPPPRIKECVVCIHWHSAQGPGDRILAQG